MIVCTVRIAIVIISRADCKSSPQIGWPEWLSLASQFYLSYSMCLCVQYAHVFCVKPALITPPLFTLHAKIPNYVWRIFCSYKLRARICWLSWQVQLCTYDAVCMVNIVVLGYWFWPSYLFIHLYVVIYDALLNKIKNKIDNFILYISVSQMNHRDEFAYLYENSNWSPCDPGNLEM